MYYQVSNNSGIGGSHPPTGGPRTRPVVGIGVIHCVARFSVKKRAQEKMVYSIWYVSHDTRYSYVTNG